MREAHILSWKDMESGMEASGLFLALFVCFTFIQQWKKNLHHGTTNFTRVMCVKHFSFIKKKKKKEGR